LLRRWLFAVVTPKVLFKIAQRAKLLAKLLV
jgi:hypothetical protein